MEYYYLIIAQSFVIFKVMNKYVCIFQHLRGRGTFRHKDPAPQNDVSNSFITFHQGSQVIEYR